ncbi:MAG TPA: selenocysteine-specific translation elongation factor [Steroidobacteraceae bacterium]|nr:selenocysteine-specific translation elongation factor [Steroidobacteraceae bacterium]
MTQLSLGAKQLVLGVIGHVDHGKTALVRALTGQDTDRLLEEKRRGISIALGFAHLDVGAEIDLIDMPGHERFVRTMISGATGIDAVLLVVAANEGIQPQTIEHIDIANLLGLDRAVVAISKTDLVAAETARRVADDALRLLARRGLQAPPPIMTSALSGQGIDGLRQALKATAAQRRSRAADGVALLPIDRAFSIAGHGPVVTGTLRGAAIAAGDTLELLPLRRAVRVRAVEVHGVRVATAAPGQRVALNLRDVDIAELERGMVLAAPDALELSQWLTISVRAVEGAPPLPNGMRLRAMLGTDELDVRLRLLDREVLGSGEMGVAQLRCVRPVALPAGEHVVLRIASPPRTVAGGKILEPRAERRQRHCASILKRLEELRVLPRAAMIAAEVEREAGTTLRHLSQLSALAVPRLVELIGTLPLVITRSGCVIKKAELDQLLAGVPSLLAAHAMGLSRDALQSALPSTAAAALDEALGTLLARGVIEKRANQFVVPRASEDLDRARREAQVASEVAETLRRGGLTPPDPGAIVTSVQSKRAVDRLLREGVIVRALDRTSGKELLFHREAIEEAQRRLAPLLEQAPGLRVTDVGAALGISRKYSLPLLDHLDTIRFTRRVNDRRIRGTR